MEGVVLAGGEGRRMRPVSGEDPKPLVEVAGRPLLAYPLDRLADLGARELLVVVGRGGERLIGAFGDRWRGRPLRWLRQPEPLGPAHALALAGESVTTPFMMMHGDVVYGPGVRLAPVNELFQRESPDAALLTERRDPRAVERGAVRVAPDGTVLDLSEYPGPAARGWGRVAAGFAVVAESVVRACREVSPSREGERELPDALRRLLRAGGRVVAVDLEGERVNVNAPADVERAERLLEGEGG